MKRSITTILMALAVLLVNGQLGQKVQGQTAGGLAGTWVFSTQGGNTVTLLLYANGQAELDGETLQWSTSGNKLTMKGGGSTIQYNYKQSGNSLTLSGGDLGQPATFTRNGGGGQEGPSGGGQGGDARELLGTWTAQGMQFTFEPGGRMRYNDKTMDYRVNGNTLYCNNAQAGVNVTYQYEVSQGHLMLRYNGNTIMLQKKGGGAGGQGNMASGSSGKKPGFLGSWVSNNNEHLTMMEGGRMTLEGYELTYTYDASTITVNAPAGKVVFSYTLNGNNFNVTNSGVTTYYKQAGNGGGGAQSSGGGARGNIDPTMVGRWGVMSSGGGGYNSSGSYSSEEYFILNANGTYEYHSQSSRSVTGYDQYGDQTINGGTNGGGADQGTWSVKGNVLIANSRTRGVQQYPFQKRNNKNGDPCIVIDGTEYVSYYQKAPWR
jgi:hypothetical protein